MAIRGHVSVYADTVQRCTWYRPIQLCCRRVEPTLAYAYHQRAGGADHISPILISETRPYLWTHRRDANTCDITN